MLLLLLSLAAYLVLHFVEPNLGMTWGFAHLDRAESFPWLGAGLVVLCPIVVQLGWGRADKPKPTISWVWVGAAIVVLWACFLWWGITSPAPPICPDTWLFRNHVASPTVMPRWLLSLWTLQVLWPLLNGALDVATFIRTVTTLAMAVTLVAMSGAAYRLARSLREWIGLTLIVWTAFGVLQLGLGYVDVYPIVELLLALYVYTGIRALQGEGSSVWPFLIVGLAPFFYLGLALLALSALSLGLILLRRDGLVRMVPAAAACLLAVGISTVPAYGIPFNVMPIVQSARSLGEFGLSPDGIWLPGWYFWTGDHALELMNGLILTDGIGVLLLLVFGARVIREPVAWFLFAVTVPILVDAVLMDPLFGPYADWDLFSYLAVCSSLLGGYAFVVWCRGRRWAGALLGLVLAANGTHLLARLNGIDLAFEQHIQESPWHGVGKLASPPGLAGRDPSRTRQIAVRR